MRASVCPNKKVFLREKRNRGKERTEETEEVRKHRPI